MSSTDDIEIYRRRHNLANLQRVRFSFAGGHDFQGWLAAEILIKSQQKDRVIESCKWLLIASITAEFETPGPCLANHKANFNFLTSSTESADVDHVFELARLWFEQKSSDEDVATNQTPYFRAHIEAIYFMSRLQGSKS